MTRLLRIALAWPLALPLIVAGIVLAGLGIGSCPSCPSEGRCRRCGR